MNQIFPPSITGKGAEGPGSGHASVCQPPPSASRLVGPAAVFTCTGAGFDSQKRSAAADRTGT